MKNAKSLLAISVVAFSLVITGCASTGATNSNNTNAAKKAGLGALAGAVLGAGISKATGGEKQDVMLPSVLHLVQALVLI